MRQPSIDCKPPELWASGNLSSLKTFFSLGYSLHQQKTLTHTFYLAPSVPFLDGVAEKSVNQEAAQKNDCIEFQTLPWSEDSFVNPLRADKVAAHTYPFIYKCTPINSQICVLSFITICFFSYWRIPLLLHGNNHTYPQASSVHVRYGHPTQSINCIGSHSFFLPWVIS